MRILLFSICFAICLIGVASKGKKCKYCSSAFTDFIDLVRLNASDVDLKTILLYYYPKLGYAESVCGDMVDLYFPIIKFVIESEPNITAKTICSHLLQGDSKCKLKLPSSDWSIELSPPLNASEIKIHNATMEKKHLRILQITDFHYDSKYQTGAQVNCGKPVCCQDIDPLATKVNQAGQWGSYYECDVPLKTIQSALAHIAETHKDLDYIYVTGDYVDHARWELTWDHNFNEINNVWDEITRYFPNVTIIPIIGNHEPSPMDEFSPTKTLNRNVSTDPLYEFVINKWHWLPADAKSSILNGGYYTIGLRPNFRVIILNNSVCLSENWWIIFDQNILAEQLHWLQNVLYRAEQNGEFVHILAHVPNGYKTCNAKWAGEYNRIVERYSHIIAAQFNGHTHRDEFNIYFTTTVPWKPISVAWNGGSISMWTTVNSNYRIYSVDPNNYGVVDHETWIFNLTEANANASNTPQWYMEYRFKDTYNLPDLTPRSLLTFTEQMAMNDNILHLYTKNYIKHGDLGLHYGCYNKCMMKRLCDIVVTQFGSNGMCNYLVSLFKEYESSSSSSSSSSNTNVTTT